MAGKIKFQKREKSPLNKETRKWIRGLAKEEIKCMHHTDAFLDLIDACGIYAYYTKMCDRYPKNSYYRRKAENMVDEIDRLTWNLAVSAKKIGWRIGRREKLANMLIEDKERRKVYKSYLTRYWDKKRLTLSSGDLEVNYQYLLKKRAKKAEKEAK